MRSLVLRALASLRPELGRARALASDAAAAGGDAAPGPKSLLRAELVAADAPLPTAELWRRVEGRLKSKRFMKTMLRQMAARGEAATRPLGDAAARGRRRFGYTLGPAHRPQQGEARPGLRGA